MDVLSEARTARQITLYKANGKATGPSASGLTGRPHTWPPTHRKSKRHRFVRERGLRNLVRAFSCCSSKEKVGVERLALKSMPSCSEEKAAITSVQQQCALLARNKDLHH